MDRLFNDQWSEADQNKYYDVFGERLGDQPDMELEHPADQTETDAETETTRRVEAEDQAFMETLKQNLGYEDKRDTDMDIDSDPDMNPDSDTDPRPDPQI